MHDLIVNVFVNKVGEGILNHTHGLAPKKMVVKFHPGLRQILRKVFVSKNMQFECTKYCSVVTLRYSNENTKCKSKQYIER